MSQNALLFAVQHRSVDLVAMTALHALRDQLGLGEALRFLRRDELVLIEDAADTKAWAEACSSTQHWFNPNKHRHAIFSATPGAREAARKEKAFPRPWLGRLLSTDRPDLAATLDTGNAPSGDEALSAWLASEGSHALSVAVWDHESAFDDLPHGAWPNRKTPILRATMWTLILDVGSDAAAARLAGRAILASSRRGGLLVNPHMEGWAPVFGPVPSAEELKI